MRVLNNTEFGAAVSGGAFVKDPIFGGFDYEGSNTMGGLLGGRPMDGLRGLIGGVLIGGTGGAMAGMKLAVTGGFLGGAAATIVGAIYGGIIGGAGGGTLGAVFGSEIACSYGWRYLNDVLGGNI